MIKNIRLNTSSIDLYNSFVIHFSNQPSIRMQSDYVILEELGIGASATVNLVSRRGDAKVFASKILKKTQVPLLSWTKDCKLGIIPMEVSILSRLNHPNIISFEEILEDEINFYIIMETLSDSKVCSIIL